MTLHSYLVPTIAVGPPEGYSLGQFLPLDQLREIINVDDAVLEVRWDIYAKVKNWEACLDIGKAMVKLDSRRFTGWINRSFALHELKRTQEACDQLHEGLYRFRDESLIWYNLACYACVLGDMARTRKMLDKAIELGGDRVKLQALDDPDLLGVWVSGGN